MLLLSNYSFYCHYIPKPILDNTCHKNWVCHFSPQKTSVALECGVQTTSTVTGPKPLFLSTSVFTVSTNAGYHCPFMHAPSSHTLLCSYHPPSVEKCGMSFYNEHTFPTNFLSFRSFPSIFFPLRFLHGPL